MVKDAIVNVSLFHPAHRDPRIWDCDASASLGRKAQQPTITRYYFMKMITDALYALFSSRNAMDQG
jgi:hypothetical protein